MTRLLEGIKILEVGNWVAVPSACTILADLGAEVTKVEHPVTGDPVRGVNVSTTGVVPHTGGLNIAFELLNRGKRSVGVNLESAGGQDVVRKLVLRSDVMLTNLTPHRQERYGLRYEDICSINPRMVYLVLTGYGMAGPERDRSGFDYAAYWARSGIMVTLGEQGDTPVQQRPGMGDLTTALAMVGGIGMALYERERSGKGQRIECSLLHSGLWVLGGDVVAALRERKAVQRNSRGEARNPLFNFYRAQDDKWLQLVMIQADRFWPGFCRALGLEHLVHDPRFDSLARRAEHHRELIGILEERFATRPRADWARRLDDERCIWAPIQSLDDVIVDPQVLANDYFTSLTHATEGEYELVTPPLKFGRTPGEVTVPAPELGEHTESTLLDLGYTWEEIASLKEQGAIT